MWKASGMLSHVWAQRQRRTLDFRSQPLWELEQLMLMLEVLVVWVLHRQIHGHHWKHAWLWLLAPQLVIWLLAVRHSECQGCLGLCDGNVGSFSSFAERGHVFGENTCRRSIWTHPDVGEASEFTVGTTPCLVANSAMFWTNQRRFLSAAALRKRRWFVQNIAELATKHGVVPTRRVFVSPDFNGNRSPLADPSLRGSIIFLRPRVLVICHSPKSGRETMWKASGMLSHVWAQRQRRTLDFRSQPLWELELLMLMLEVLVVWVLHRQIHGHHWKHAWLWLLAPQLVIWLLAVRHSECQGCLGLCDGNVGSFSSFAERGHVFGEKTCRRSIWTHPDVGEASEFTVGTTPCLVANSAMFWTNQRRFLSAAALRNRRWFVQNIAELATKHGVVPTRGVFVGPDFNGNRSPLADPSLRGSIIGLGPTGDNMRATSIETLRILYLATVQALSYSTRAIVETINSARVDEGITSIKAVHVCGGLAQNLYLQEHCNVLGLPFCCTDNPGADVIRGSAMLAATAAGEFSSVYDAIRGMSKTGKLMEPSTEVRLKAYHDARYNIFLRMQKQQQEYYAMESRVFEDAKRQRRWHRPWSPAALIAWYRPTVPWNVAMEKSFMLLARSEFLSSDCEGDVRTCSLGDSSTSRRHVPSKIFQEPWR